MKTGLIANFQTNSIHHPLNVSLCEPNIRLFNIAVVEGGRAGLWDALRLNVLFNSRILVGQCIQNLPQREGHKIPIHL